MFWLKVKRAVPLFVGHMAYSQVAEHPVATWEAVLLAVAVGLVGAVPLAASTLWVGRARHRARV